MKDDAGVFDQTTGKWMMRVAAHPQAGQYVFDRERGYTFAAADEGHTRYFVGDPLPPLTAEEIAELRDWIRCSVLYWRTHDNEVGVATTLPRLLDEVERSRALLKRIEWGAHGSECPSCGVDAPPFGTHEPGCELAALIG